MSKKKQSPTAGRNDLVLGIETATSHGSVAVTGGAGLLGEILLFNPRAHSEKLLPVVEALLHMLNLAPADLSAVAVSIGPGSFTGLRIGVASAKGLSFSLGIPLFSVPTLEVLAAHCPPGERPVCAFLDARRGEVFFAIFNYNEGRLIKVHGEALARPEDLPNLLPPGSILIGEITAKCRALLPGPRDGEYQLAPPHLNYPRAAVVAARGMEMFLGGHPSVAETVLPLYLRPSDAEANFSPQNINPKS